MNLLPRTMLAENANSGIVFWQSWQYYFTEILVSDDPYFHFSICRNSYMRHQYLYYLLLLCGINIKPYNSAQPTAIPRLTAIARAAAYCFFAPINTSY